MSTGMIIILSVALVLAVLLGVFALVFRWIRRLRKEAIHKLREDVGAEKVYKVDDCNFFGVESSGYKQVVGNGMLALTGEGIRFRMLAPGRTFFVPLKTVREVSHPRWFHGKSKGRKLLRVDFFNEKGEKDACAWLVRSPGWWGKAIMNLRAGIEPEDP